MTAVVKEAPEMVFPTEAGCDMKVKDYAKKDVLTALTLDWQDAKSTVMLIVTNATC